MLRHDVELLDGHIIKKTPKSPLHTFICQWCWKPCGAACRQDWWCGKSSH